MKRAHPSLLNQRAFSRFPAPSVALLELTNRCNHACVHCVRDSPSYPDPDTMTTAEWMGVLEDLARINTFAVCFTGGEAALYPDLLPLIERARELRMAVSLKTNGILLPKLAPRLKAAGVGNMDVSLYGASAATHERCTGIRGSFELTVEGIRAATNAGIPVNISITLFRWNVHELEAMRDLADELGCRPKRDYFLVDTDLGRSLDEDLLTPAQMREVEEKWPGCTLPENQNGPGGIKICTQGVNILAVTPRGEILSCITIRKPIGRVRHEGIVPTWLAVTGGASGTPRRAHDIDYGRFARCGGCDLRPKCHTCIGQSLAATGDFYEPPLERCFITMALYGSAVTQEAPLAKAVS
jgi:radical SAM protein with 4Fe4S-binding SPASM domain